MSVFSDLYILAAEGEVPRIDPPGQDKRSVRAAVLTTRRSMPPAVRAAADASIGTHLGALRPGTVCAYAPMTGEPGGSGLLTAFARARVLLPVLLPDGDLDWAEYTPGRLATGRYGLAEPIGPRLGPDAVAAADLVVVPGVAAALDGTRLGRGGGSYDRALTRVAEGVPVVAVLYDGELFARLPSEPHDRPVNAVIMPSGARLTAHTGRTGLR